MLVMSIAANSGHLQLASSFAWIGSPAALIAFGLATALEVTGYYVPWLDHFLDSIATPTAIIAGTIITASMVTGVSPFLKWTLAIIAGGGIAGTVQATTVLARGISLASTGGLGNPLVATLELGGSIITSLAAVIAPFFAITLVVLLLGIFSYKLMRRRFLTPRTL